jgi:hypothetical protein
MLLTLVSISTYSQRIRTIGSDTFVTFSREQAKAINDTFVVQKQTIKSLKYQDSINISKLDSFKQHDSIRTVRDSITYYQQLLPLISELKGLLVAQIETPFKRNFDVGLGGGLSTYFGSYRPYTLIADGRYYMPSGVLALKYNFHKHMSTRFELFGTKVYAPPINNNVTAGSLLFDFNIAPNMYSIRVGMIPIVSVGYNMFGISTSSFELSNESLIVGVGLKGYFTSNTAIEINVRHVLTDIDQIGKSDRFLWGHLMITRKIK